MLLPVLCNKKRATKIYERIKCALHQLILYELTAVIVSSRFTDIIFSVCFIETLLIGGAGNNRYTYASEASYV